MRRRRRGLVKILISRHTDRQVQNSLKTENSLLAALRPAAPFGGGGLGSILFYICFVEMLFCNFVIYYCL